MFYEIIIEVGHGSDGHSLETKGYIKRFKLFWKDELIEDAKRETDARIINQLNHFYKDCQFDFLQAYRKYGVVFHGTARIRNRMSGHFRTVYEVSWNKDYWNLNFRQYKSDKLSI
ncbi:hypothetical protein [Bacillus xiapuensis]|uniref:Uncharacterized protein n=1 Tax=Bacillus xiapuensis TaxID=2014075 RepID=A0ABU6N7U6_9BACI|nr:hypothetical protein [Bacillus xiapuensis]